MEGSLPSRFGILTKLTSLDLRGSKLSSSIPSELGLLSDLSSLELLGNDLSGSIPAQIGDLPSLETFQIEENDSVDLSSLMGFAATSVCLLSYCTQIGVGAKQSAALRLSVKCKLITLL